MFKFEPVDSHIEKNSCFYYSSPVKVFPLRESTCPLIKLEWITVPTILPEAFKPNVEIAWNTKINTKDIWIVSYPKSGTTWTQEMIWLIVNNLNYDLSKSKLLNERSPFFEDKYIEYPEERINSFDYDPSAIDPQVIKTHLPASLLPKNIWSVKPKIIYVYRNVNDVVVSYYYHHVNLYGYNGTITDFTEEFLADKLMWSPYKNHVNEFWNLRNESNILFLTYEEMKSNLILVIKEVCEFLNKSYSDEEILILSKHLSFESMKENNSCNHQLDVVEPCATMLGKASGWKFLRKGESNAYKNDLSVELIEKIDNKFSNLLKLLKLTN